MKKLMAWRSVCVAEVEQQEQKYTAELNAALAEYNELKTQTADFDPDEFAMA